MKSRRINSKRVGDMIIIGASMVALLGIIGYAQPLVISPIDKLSTTNTSVLFSFDKADSILIDDNMDFSSPTQINAADNLVVNLRPGVYYWKVKGMAESKVSTLTIVSEVDLRMRESGDKYELVNAGNTKLNVDIYNGSVLQGNVVLDVDERSNESGTLFVGGQENEH